LKNSQKLLLLKHIFSAIVDAHDLIVEPSKLYDISRPNIEFEVEVGDVLGSMRKELNGLKKETVPFF